MSNSMPWYSDPRTRKPFGHQYHGRDNPYSGAPIWVLEQAAAMGYIIRQNAELQQQNAYIIERLRSMSVTLDRATASLTNITKADDAVALMIKALLDEIRNTGTDDPLVLQKLDEIDQHSANLVAQALANTPAAPSP